MVSFISVKAYVSQPIGRIFIQTNYNARFPAIFSIPSVSQFIRLALVTIEVCLFLIPHCPGQFAKKFCKLQPVQPQAAQAATYKMMASLS